jgi:hypothetical protein
MKTPQPWPHPLGAILLRVRHRQEQNSTQGNHPCGSCSALHFPFAFGLHCSPSWHAYIQRCELPTTVPCRARGREACSALPVPRSTHSALHLDATSRGPPAKPAGDLQGMLHGRRHSAADDHWHLALRKGKQNSSPKRVKSANGQREPEVIPIYQAFAQSDTRSHIVRV